MESLLNARIHLLLTRTGTMANKADLVFGFTKGRSESTRDMTNLEAKELVKYLESINTAYDPADNMRKKIISMAREIGWEIKTDAGKFADMERIKHWVLHYGYLKKAFNSYSVTELPKLVTQFEKVYKDFLHRL